MEDKNELSDIVLEKGGDKKTSVKKIILLVALLIVLFLVVLVVMKLVNKPTEQNQQALTLPPAPTTAVKEETKNDALFEQVPIQKKEEDNFEKMVQKLKEQEKEQKTPLKEPTPPTPPTVEETQQAKQEVPTKIESLVEEAKQNVQKVQKVAELNNLYIQVGATLKQNPSDKFLKSIEDAGYKYTLHRVKVGDKTATKILVGPYKDRTEANTQMPTIKQKINKEAFLYRVKD